MRAIAIDPDEGLLVSLPDDVLVARELSFSRRRRPLIVCGIDVRFAVRVYRRLRRSYSSRPNRHHLPAQKPARRTTSGVPRRARRCECRRFHLCAHRLRNRLGAREGRHQPLGPRTLALFLVASGVKLLLDARGNSGEGDDTWAHVLPTPPPVNVRAGVAGLPFLIGFLQGAANPGPFVNWTLFISFLIGHRLLDPSPAGAGGFAVGVGLGVFSWFTLLIRTAHRLKDHAGPWVARSTIVAGAFLLVTGLYFGWLSFAAS